MVRAVAQYMISETGSLTTHTQKCMAFVRVEYGELRRKLGGGGDDGDSEVVEDSTSGKGAPDAEMMVSPLAWRDHGHKKFDVPEAMGISATLLRPPSKGTVTLKSTDRWDKPLIDPCYLSTKQDIEILVRGVRLSHELANTEPLKSTLDQNIQHPLLDHALGRNRTRKSKRSFEVAQRPSGDCQRAYVYQQQQEGSKAEASYIEVKEIYARLGAEQNVAGAIWDLGQFYWFGEEFSKAEASYTEAKEIFARLGAEKSIADVLWELGHVYLDLDKDKAKAAFIEAREIYTKIGDREGFKRVIDFLAFLWEDQRCSTEAEDFLGETSTEAKDEA